MPILSRMEVLEATGTPHIPWAGGCLRPVLGWRTAGDTVVYFEKQGPEAAPVLESKPQTEKQRRSLREAERVRVGRGVDCYALFPHGSGGRKFRRLLRRKAQSTWVD